MAHVNFVLLNFVTMGDLVDQPISLDCWRATLIFVSQKPGTIVTIDGVPVDFLVDGATSTGTAQRLELGGLIVRGEPVNIKHDLRVSQSASDPFNALLVLQYYVPDGN